MSVFAGKQDGQEAMVLNVFALMVGDVCEVYEQGEWAQQEDWVLDQKLECYMG